MKDGLTPISLTTIEGFNPVPSMNDLNNSQPVALMIQVHNPETSSVQLLSEAKFTSAPSRPAIPFRMSSDSRRATTNFLLALVYEWNLRPGENDRSFARQCSIVPSNISQWRGGLYNPADSIQARVAKALGVTRSRLLEMVDDYEAGKRINMTPLLDHLANVRPEVRKPDAVQSPDALHLARELEKERSHATEIERRLEHAEKQLEAAEQVAERERARANALELEIEKIRQAQADIQRAMGFIAGTASGDRAKPGVKR